ncbi:HigA family addiction module antitoxin [Methylobacterium sp. J-026]|uniref:HigA family addiction module antitoxin n=1 Tax=Methylobacterium sp. J-026 TaxID=2836624 RepID=UPI001FBACCD0|nr:HigA family addiction module antitoxin [Methylobacterium sp. J-026]MCJ2137135.1 HigA family addiction module antitoxin [Methylobacterium sp. J-026]
MHTTYRLENPGHPGGFVRRQILEPRNLTAMSAASRLGVPRQVLSEFLAEKTSLTADLALRIEIAFGCGMETLMEMQTRFDIAQARKNAGAIRNELAATCTDTGSHGPDERPQPIIKRVYASR